MNLKKIYFDMRIGQSVVFPILAMINFIIISYSLTDIPKYISFELYIPVVMVGMVFTLIIIGKLFIRKQQATDFTVSYENNIELIKDLNAIMSGDSEQIKKRQEYHKSVLKRHEQ